MLEIITYKLRIKAYNTYTRIKVVEMYQDNVRISQKATKDTKEIKDRLMIDRCIREGYKTNKTIKRKLLIQSTVRKLKELNEGEI